MKAVTDTRYYDEIAERIQVYGNSGPYTPAQMPAAIDDIVNDAREMGEYDGYQHGYGSGYSEGEAQGLVDGNAQGRQEQKAEFWHKYLQPLRNEQNTYYLFAGCGWNEDTFFPYTPTGTSENPELMQPIGAASMFSYFSRAAGSINLSERLKECNWRLDTSKSLSLAQTFNGARITVIPKISAKGTTFMDRTFNGCSKLVTIEGLEFKEDGTNTFYNTFAGCSALEDIDEITGVIGDSISFADSPNLKSESVDRIIDSLKNLENGDAARTFTLNATVKSNMTDAQKAKITTKGWTLA